ncbi:ThuA domain-containing protein [Microbacterium aurum]|jgi:type 1 glutamine amidotransferase
MRALIASGAGRYGDPWHPFAGTSERLAAVLREAGFDVEIDDDVDAAMRRLGDVDLLAVNAGDPWRDDPGDGGVDPASVAGFDAALRRGIGVLALHSAVSSLRDYPAWGAAIGALWLPGVSHHPPHGRTRIDIVGDADRLRDFELDDERYCRLQPIGQRTIIARHGGDGRPEPAAWTTRRGDARIAVDALGHDDRSYDSPGHRALIAHLARWAARAD